MDRKKACAILGLDESASMEEIERAYDILLRRKMQQQREGKNEAEDTLFHKYAEAYAYLKGDTGPAKQSKGGRILNSIVYRRIPILVALAVLIITGTIIRTSFFRPKADLSIQLCGEIYPQDLGLDGLGKDIKELMPDLNILKLGITSLRHDSEDPKSLTNSNKLFIDLTLGDIDVFIMDQFIFAKYSSLGIFMDLGATADEISLPDGQRSGLYAQSKNDDAEKLYGIDVTKSRVLYDAGIAGNKKILVVIDRSKKKENAMRLIRILVPENPTYDADIAADPG